MKRNQDHAERYASDKMQAVPFMKLSLEDLLQRMEAEIVTAYLSGMQHAQRYATSQDRGKRTRSSDFPDTKQSDTVRS